MNTPLKILLADDDTDDCLFFENALKALQIPSTLTIIHDGEQLMIYLFENVENLPDVIFLDLNMPRKNGFECLSEIKQNEKLKHLTVVVFTPPFKEDISYNQLTMEMLLKKGAYHYISKTANMEDLKQSINKALITLTEKESIDEQEKNHDHYIKP